MTCFVYKYNWTLNISWQKNSVWLFSIKLNKKKELSVWHTLWFSNPYIFATQCHRPMQSVRSYNLSLKYQRFAPAGFKDIVIINLDL